MTTAQPRTTDSPSTSRDSPPDRKAVLFCPECGHEGALDGEWRVRTAADRQCLRCPECDAVVDERPVANPTTPASRLVTAPGRLLADAVDRSWAVWSAFLARV